MEVIKNKRILALCGIICLILGCMLPYFEIEVFGYSDSISLWGYWEGKIVLVLTLANALFIFQDYIEEYIPQLFDNWVGNIVRKAKNPKFALVPTILVVVFAVSLIIRLDIDSEYVKYGLGFWVLWIGIIALVGHSIFYKKGAVQQAVNIPVQPTPGVSYQPIGQPEMMNYQQTQQPEMVNYQQTIQPELVNYQPVQQVPVQQPQANVEPAKKFCSQCGNQVDVNAAFCFMCGHKF